MTKHYKKEDITVVWKPELCIHSGICARGLASVFKPKEKPWVQTEGASKEEIVRQVLKCPSKALSIL
ncbi:MAG TPA: (4Fe-4S)-binding protein [Flavobacteriales bacterium]